LRRRLRSGLTANLIYTFSKSLDNDSFVGGQGPIAAGAISQTSSAGTIAQNWLNLRGERGLSNFDQRHLLNTQIQYTTGMGLGGRSLLSGWRGRVYKEWTVVTNISVGSGLPETPTYFETLQGSACTSCIRPNVTGASIHAAPAGLFLNPAAFAAPAAGQFGDARVGSITGPDQFSLGASMARTFRLHDRYNLDVRVDSTNTLNHVTYSSYVVTVGSPLFGSPPSSANAMRALTATIRLRF
jgi:trimeric autotransporter adhesin